MNMQHRDIYFLVLLVVPEHIYISRVRVGNDGFALGGTADYKNVTGSSAADTHSKFEVLANGTLYANNAYLLGAIHAKEGYIGNNSTLSNN